MTLQFLFYAAFLVATAMLFWRTTPAQAAAAIVFGGWIWLPPGPYPHPPVGDAFPFWIIGSALPSDMLLSKAWVAPLAAMTGSLIMDAARWRQFRFSWVDVPMVAWCLWPLLSSALRPSDPAGATASLYLVGVWALPWLLGRLYASDRQGRHLFADTLIIATLTLAPVALIEGVSNLRVYDLLFGQHPFAADGVSRYFGYRPLALFENGNQYGLWVACASIVAISRAWDGAPSLRRRTMRWAAAALTLMAVLSQSAGAILLMLIAIAILFGARRGIAQLRPLVLAAVLLLGIGGGIYIAAGGSLRSAVVGSPVAMRMVAALKQSGRGSLAWRAAQDDKLIPMVRPYIWTGSGQWDWWRPLGTRSWGLPLQVIGQFGLIGLMLLIAPFGLTVARAITHSSQRSATRAAKKAPSSQWLPIAVGTMAMLDALLNSFIFFPAILLVAGIAQPTQTKTLTQTKTDRNPKARPVSHES